MPQIIYDQALLSDGNIFKFEGRLKTQLNKYIENGALLVTYFAQDENASTVDRGIKNIDELFGKHSPLRFIQIEDFPIYGFGSANPENTDEQQVEDINVTGDCIILPSTIVPNPNDCFIIKHLHMCAIFQVTNVIYDSMKVDGFYKISYRLHTTSEETLQMLMKQVIHHKHTDLNAVGTDLNPIITEDDFIIRGKINQMVSKMISAYRALFYNHRHNCFIYDNGIKYFDMCANEFIAKHSLMNIPNDYDVIVLNDKLNINEMPLYYNKSIYSWLELGAPARLLQKFPYVEMSSDIYPYSSFSKWYDEVMVITPLGTNEKSSHNIKTLFDDAQFSCYLGDKEPLNDYEKLLWNYIHHTALTIHDISLYTADALISSVDHWDVFFYTPIIIYIIREIMSLN